jgi:hypothetical protein
MEGSTASPAIQLITCCELYHWPQPFPGWHNPSRFCTLLFPSRCDFIPAEIYSFSSHRALTLFSARKASWRGEPKLALLP